MRCALHHLCCCNSRLHLLCRGGQRFDCGAVGEINLKTGRTTEEASTVHTSQHRDIVLPAEGDPLRQELEWAQHQLARVTFRGEHGKWKKYVCIIAALPAGTRYVSVTVLGRDTQFWHGHYGFKFASPSLTWTAAKHPSDHSMCSAECLTTVFGDSGVSS